MKLVTLTAAATLALAAPAFAYTGVSPSMVDSVENILDAEGFENVDVTTLSDEQIVEIYVAGTSGDMSDRDNWIRAALDEDNYQMRSVSERRMGLTATDVETGLEPAGESSIVRSVQNFLDSEGIEADASALTDAQVAEIYFQAYSTDGAASRTEIMSVLGM